MKVVEKVNLVDREREFFLKYAFNRKGLLYILFCNGISLILNCIFKEFLFYNLKLRKYINIKIFIK